MVRGISADSNRDTIRNEFERGGHHRTGDKDRAGHKHRAHRGRAGHNHRAGKKERTDSVSIRDVLSLSSDRRQQVADDPATALTVNSAAQLNVKVRSRSQIRVDDDGSFRAVNQTKLRFSYDLKLDDGQTIQLRAKAKVRQSVTQNEAGDIAIKTKVKFQFSLIQQDVSDGLEPLQGGTNDGETNPLQAFLDVVDSVVADFADDGQIDADTLIHTVLDEFNSLFASLSGALPEPPDTSPADTPDLGGDVIDALPPSGPSITTTDDVDTEAPVQPANVEPETGTVADDSAPADTVVIAPLPETAPTDEADPGQETLASATDATANDASARDVLQEVRIRFVQSFSQVIRTLTPNGDDDTGQFSLVQKSHFKLNASFQYSERANAGSAANFLA